MKRSVGRFTFKIKFDTRMFGFGMILFIHKGSRNIPEEFVGAGMVELNRIGRFGNVGVEKINFLFENRKSLFLVENKFFHNSITSDGIAKINKSRPRLGDFGVGNTIVLGLTNDFFVLRREKTESKGGIVFFNFDIGILIDKIVGEISGKVATSTFEGIMVV